MIAGIVLSAGFGTRLKPVTDEVPKPAIPFLNKPMVWYALHSLKLAGIRRFAANVHHLPDIMASCLERCAESLQIERPAIYRENDGILGTGGGARSCCMLLPDADRFVIYHGDVLCGVDLDAAIQSHIQSGCGITLVVAPRPQNSKLGMVGVDDNGDIMRIRDWYRLGCDENTKFHPCCFTGIHIVERHVLEQLPADVPVCLVTEIYPELLGRGGRIHAFRMQDFFADVGTPATYLEAQQQVLDNPSLLPGAEIQMPDFDDSVRVNPPVSISGDVAVCDCTIGPNVCLCSGAQVLPGEKLQNEMRFGHHRVYIVTIQP